MSVSSIQSVTRFAFVALAAFVLASPAATAHRRYGHAEHYRHHRHHSSYVNRRGDGGRAHASEAARSVVQVRDPEAFRTPVTEMRGIWVTRYSILTPIQIYNVVQTAKHFGFNTLFVQVRGRGDAFYNSSLEPRAEELAHEPASFDPLAEIIHQAHAAGIQVHAWLNCCLVWSGPRRPISPDHVLNAHPDWFDRRSDDSFSAMATNQCEGAFLSPANPAARAHIHDVFMDIVNHYDVDGIHFDYIRYPNETYDYSASTLSAFCDEMRQTRTDVPPATANQAVMVAYAKANPDIWGDWRRQQVTTLVEDTCRDAKAAKPGIICTAAVFADWKDAYDTRGQDWKRWLTDGALDAVIPMAYGADTAKVAAQIRDAESAATAAGRYCYAGLGSWHISDESTVQKIEAARAVGAQGFVLFSYGGVTNDGASLAYLHHVTAETCENPAVLPSMAWLKTAATAPENQTPAETGEH